MVYEEFVNGTHRWAVLVNAPADSVKDISIGVLPPHTTLIVTFTKSPPSPTFDWSQFHPLDHHPWQRRCWSRKTQPSYTVPFKGGPWRHLMMMWEFRWRGKTMGSWYRLVNCSRGKHEEHVYKTPSGYSVRCNWCSWWRAATEEERNDFPQWTGHRDK